MSKIVSPWDKKIAKLLYLLAVNPDRETVIRRALECAYVEGRTAGEKSERDFINSQKCPGHEMGG